MAKLKTLTTNYTTVSNIWLKDKNLSAKAKGVICFLQSLDDGWNYSLEGLATQFKDGRDSIKSAIDELRESGYLIWERCRNTDGTLGATVVKIAEKPNVVKPTLVKPTLEKQQQQNINKQIIKEQNKNNNTNVLAKAEKKDKYGRLTEINDAFTYWETSMGYKITSKMKMNRFAACNLIKTHTLEGLSRVIQALPVIHAEQYAPAKAKPSDFIELQANWNSVMAYGRSKVNKTNIRVTRIN